MRIDPKQVARVAQKLHEAGMRAAARICHEQPYKRLSDSGSTYVRAWHAIARAVLRGGDWRTK